MEIKKALKKWWRDQGSTLGLFVGIGLMIVVVVAGVTIIGKYSSENYQKIQINEDPSWYCVQTQDGTKACYKPSTHVSIDESKVLHVQVSLVRVRIDAEGHAAVMLPNGCYGIDKRVSHIDLGGSFRFVDPDEPT